MNADAIVVGGGLAGLVATAELVDAGKRVVLVDQEPEPSLGGQAFWSFGGIFLVDSPEQRRMGVRDSYDLAWQDWQGTAGFDRPEDLWPSRWAEAYVQWAAAEKRSWMRERGIRFLPNPGWAERGGYGAIGHGNSVPRFHVTWGTGPGVVDPFVTRVREGVAQGTRGTAFPPPRRRAVGDGRRGRWRQRRGARALRRHPRPGLLARRHRRLHAQRARRHRHVRRHRRQPRARAPELARASRPGAGPDDLRRARARRRPHARDRSRRGRPLDQPRSHVALRRGHQQLGSDLAAARHPHPARPSSLWLDALGRRLPVPSSPASTRSARSSTSCRPATTTRGSC